MKESNERACFLELAPGANNVDLKRDYVRAPASAYPTCPNRSEPKFVASEAMRVTMGK